MNEEIDKIIALIIEYGELENKSGYSKALSKNELEILSLENKSSKCLGELILKLENLKNQNKKIFNRRNLEKED